MLRTIELSMRAEGWRDLQKSGYLDQWRAVRLITDTAMLEGRIRIHGASSRRYAKKSLKVDIRAPASAEARTAIFSAQQTDPSFCRYRLADYFFRRAGLRCPRIAPLFLTLNGTPLGLYLEREPIDERFLDCRGLPQSSVYSANLGAWFTLMHGIPIESGWNKKVPDKEQSYADLEKLVRFVDEGITEARLEKLGTILDIENALDYFAVSLIVGNVDGITNNYHLYLDPRTRRFEFIPWDLDLTFGAIPAKTFPAYRNGLFEHLMALPSCRAYVRTRISEIFDADAALDTLVRFAGEIEEAYRLDPRLGITPHARVEQVEYIEYYIRAIERIVESEREGS
jgi:spore coat protein H